LVGIPSILIRTDEIVILKGKKSIFNLTYLN